MTRRHPCSGDRECCPRPPSAKLRLYVRLFHEMANLDAMFGKPGYAMEAAKFREKRAHCEAGIR